MSDIIFPPGLINPDIPESNKTTIITNGMIGSSETPIALAKLTMEAIMVPTNDTTALTTAAIIFVFEITAFICSTGSGNPIKLPTPLVSALFPNVFFFKL